MVPMHVKSVYEFRNQILAIEADIKKDVILKIKISGDLGANAVETALLEKRLTGVKLQKNFVTNAINLYYLLGAKTEKIKKEELIEAVMSLKPDRIKII
jgi:hypothetical protein